MCCKECSILEWHFESNQVELSFRPTLKLKVKRCSGHLVYKNEVETFNETTNQWTHCIVYNLNKSHHSLVASKRGLTDCVVGEARGSGCCKNEEPQSKRFERTWIRAKVKPTCFLHIFTSVYCCAHSYLLQDQCLSVQFCTKWLVQCFHLKFNFVYKM